MSSIAEYLKERYGPWGWMGQRAHDAEGMNGILSLDFMISCDHGREIDLFFRRDDVFSVERSTGVRKNWSNEDLSRGLKGPLGRAVRARWDSYGKKVSLICYRSVKCLEGASEDPAREARILAVPEKMKRFFDNKILLYENIPGLSLPSIRSLVIAPRKATFDSLRRDLGMPFVVQFPYGSGGNATYIIRSEKEYASVRELNGAGAAVIRSYINGISFNVNAVIVQGPKRAGTFCCYPSVQITGTPECGNSGAAYCGNDYYSSHRAGKNILREIERQIKITGNWMASYGYRGMFGMDFVTKNGVVYPVEINPRFQNSTSIHTSLRALAGSGEKTMFLLHIAEFLKDKDRTMKSFSLKFKEDDFMEPVKGSQIIIHNRMREGVVSGDLRPGIYRMKAGKLVYVKEAASVSECSSNKDILLTSGVPLPFTKVEPNAPLCKVQFLGPALDRADLRRFTPGVKKIISEIYRNLDIKELLPEESAVG